MKPRTTHTCEAWELLLKFFFSRRADLPALAAEYVFSPVKFPLFRRFDRGHPVPLGRIAETLACDAPHVTGLVDRLEARGLVRRQPSEEDRRVKALDLTPTGARLRAVVLVRMTKPLDSLSRLSPSEQRSLVRILRRLLD